MTNFSTLKYSLLVFLLCAIAIPIHAQHQKNTIQIIPEFASPIMFLNKDIYSGKPLYFSQQVGVDLKLKLSNKLSLGMEGQLGFSNLKNNIEATYNAFSKNDTAAFKNYNSSTMLNGILNLNYTRYNKSRKNLFEIGIGGGVQQLNQGKNTLALHNPLRINKLDTVYRDLGGKSSSPIFQLTLQNTFYLKPCIGITLGIKTQYTRTASETIYKKMPSNTNVQGAFQQFINSKNITTKEQRSFTFLPTIGISFSIGGCKPQKTEDKKPSNNCFNLNWENSTRGDSCFKGDTLKFKISLSFNSEPITYYEVYVAPYNDLNNQHLLFTLPYPSSKFYISSMLLDANKEYAVIVKLIFANKDKICMQYIAPIKRCADPCTDCKLPEKKEVKGGRDVKN